jgi:hypothetical protein
MEDQVEELTTMIGEKSLGYMQSRLKQDMQQGL